MTIFQHFKDKEAVLKAGPKERPKLKGQNVYINADFSSIVMQKRKSLLPLLEEKRKDGIRAWLQYDKLVYIEGGRLKVLRVDTDVVRERRRYNGNRESMPPGSGNLVDNQGQ